MRCVLCVLLLHTVRGTTEVQHSPNTLPPLILLMFTAPRLLRGFTTAGAGRVASFVPPPPSVVSVLKSTPCVCFDVDSTVITTEGIDELAAFAGKKEAVSELTRRAMGGSVPFHEALEARLSLISPARSLLDTFLAAHPSVFTPGVEAVIGALHARGTHVYLVSGGFTQMINPLAHTLRIPLDRVYANTILFKGGSGGYAGFDTSAPTSRDGGKAEVMRILRAKHNYASIVVIGDGATDLQARPPADVMLGYGGVVEREAVKKGADYFFYDFKALLQYI
jgi:phosphoserine phosphatase